MKPAKASVLGFRRSLRRLLRERQGSPVWKVIQELNRRIRGWTNFYRCLVSSRTFRVLDNDLYWSVKRWIQRRHTKKRRGWLNAKYFRRLGGRDWVFSAKVPNKDRQRSLFHRQGAYVGLMRASSVTIRRHVKVRAAANPFDPADYDYFRRRRPV
jgi:RNA-directed DNA polymerase